MGKSGGASALNKVVIPKCTNGHCTFSPRCTHRKKNNCDKAVKLLILLKFTLCTVAFPLTSWWGGKHEALLHAGYSVCSRRLRDPLWAQGSLPSRSTIPLEETEVRVQLDSSRWQTFSWKFNEVSLSLQGKKTDGIVISDKIWAFKLIKNFGKLASAPVILTASQFSFWETGSNVNKCDLLFLYCEMW